MDERQGLIEEVRGIARKQVALARRERRLQERHQALASAMTRAVAALAKLEGSASRPCAVEVAPLAFSPKVPRAVRARGEADVADVADVAARRRYVAEVVLQAYEILAGASRPLTIREIHAAHPERARVSRHELYKAVDQRARYEDPDFITCNGVYWLSGRPLPAGWVHPRGTRWIISPEQAVPGPRTRERGGVPHPSMHPFGEG